MKNPTEKMFNELDKFIEENDINLSNNKDDVEDMLKNFISQYNSRPMGELTAKTAETSDDFLELAESASTQKTALKYAKKALEIDPDNLDASVMVAELTASTPEKLTEKYKNLILEAEEKLKAQNYFDDDCIGEFWLIMETRPYMRLLDKYAAHLAECGQMRLAADECEKMLKLCNNDNLGARYRLMHLYVFLEDIPSALDLFKRYPEESTQFLLPLSMLYYKSGDLRESSKYLKKLCDVNKDTYKFFKNMMDGTLDEYIEDMSPYGYRPFTIEEFIIEAEEHKILFLCMSAYFLWAWSKIKLKNRNKKK